MDDAGTYLDAVGDVGVVAGLFDDVGITVGISHTDVDGFAVGQYDRHFTGCLASCQSQASGHGGRRGTGACGQSAVQWEE